MAKLYWRVKRNGKWTWRPVEVMEWGDDDDLDSAKYRWLLAKIDVDEGQTA